MTPIPAWRFWIQGSGLWVLSGLLLILGAFGVASILYIVTKNDWDIFSEIHESKFTHIISTLPYLWLCLFAIMLVLLYIDIKHTKHGYRYTAFVVVIGVVGASIAFGIGLHLMGFGQKIDSIIATKDPQHAHLFNPRLQALSRPDKGILTGRVTIIEFTAPTGKIYVENPILGGRWIIIIQPTTILPDDGIRINDRIRALGEDIGDQQFLAHIILPFNTLGLGPQWKHRDVDDEETSFAPHPIPLF